MARILADFVTLGGERHQKAQRISAENTQKMRRGEKAWGEISQGDKVRRKGRWRNVTRRQVTERTVVEKKANPVLALKCVYFPVPLKKCIPTPLD